MTKKRIIWGIIGIALLIALFFILMSSGSTPIIKTFQFAEITRGDVVNTIYCSGTLNAVGTVEVGTQVSGVLDRIYVDFNDRVKKEQILAVLDTVLLKASVYEAQANYEKTVAQLEEAKADHERNLPLYQKGYISEAEYLPYKIQLKTQEAAVKSTEATMLRAERNLKYAVIKSPINGTVIQRSVEEGQTVAASLQTPTLFIITEDLSKMEIHAEVDESDIGQIKEGQRATFEVQAYPDKEFEGTVRQVRLQPEVVQNVVNYTVVIDAANNEGLLLPGMTATIDFYVEEKRNVLLIPNTSLSFEPSQEMLQDMMKTHRQKFENIPDSLRQKMMLQRRTEMQGMGNSQNTENIKRVWFLNADDQLEMTPIRTGVSDGKMTEIISTNQLKEGDKIISGWTDEEKNNAETRQSPRGFGPGPPPF